MDYSNKDISAAYLAIASAVLPNYAVVNGDARRIASFGGNIYETFQSTGAIPVKGLRQATVILLQDMLTLGLTQAAELYSQIQREGAFDTWAGKERSKGRMHQSIENFVLD